MTFDSGDMLVKAAADIIYILGTKLMKMVPPSYVFRTPQDELCFTKEWFTW